MTPKAILNALARRELLDVLDPVCLARCVTGEELCGRRRTKNVSFARQELWWHLRRHPGMSYDEIAQLFDRDRTTVMSGVRAYLRARAGTRSAA